MLARDEIIRLKEIDRTEVIEKEYRLRDGSLVLEERFYDGPFDWWIPRVENKLAPRLERLFDEGGTVFGAFENGKLVGMTAVDPKFIGNGDTLDLSVMFVDSNFRGRGIGARLMELARKRALDMGAKRIYISSIPTQNSIDFYMGHGARVARKDELDDELLAEEPDDIHLIWELTDYLAE